MDGDLPKEILKYQVQSCWWGTVSLTTNISNPTNFFTQNQIDNEMVFFRHQSKFQINAICRCFINFIQFQMELRADLLSMLVMDYIPQKITYSKLKRNQCR